MPYGLREERFIAFRPLFRSEIKAFSTAPRSAVNRVAALLLLLKIRPFNAFLSCLVGWTPGENRAQRCGGVGRRV